MTLRIHVPLAVLLGCLSVLPVVAAPQKILFFTKSSNFEPVSAPVAGLPTGPKANEPKTPDPTYP